MSARVSRDQLHVLMTADAVGGVWSYALDLAAGLATHGVRTTIAVLGPLPDTDQRAASAAIPNCRLIATERPLDWTAASPAEVGAAGQAIGALATEQRPDIVHLNSPALAQAGRFRAPMVGVCHSCVATWWDAAASGALPMDLAWRRDLLARGYRAVDALVAPSVAFAHVTARSYGLPHAPIVVHNGRRPPDSAECLVAPGAFAFTAGRLWDKGKNIAALDRAAARLTIPVWAAGPQHGPNGDAVMLHSVLPLGRLSDSQVQGHLTARPIFVSVAHYEPFGLAVLEAAQNGCALVLSDIPTFRELWDGVALFVAADDDAALVMAVEAVAGDPALRARLGTAAQDRASRYTVAAMAAGIMAVYRSLLSGQAAALHEAAA